MKWDELTWATATKNRPERMQKTTDIIVNQAKADKINLKIIVGDASDQPIKLNPKPYVHKHDVEKRVISSFLSLVGQIDTEYVFMSPDDWYPRPGALRAMLNFMQIHPEVGIGALYFSGVPLGELGHDGMECVISTGLHSIIFANAFIMPTAVGKEVEWFDPNYTMYTADIDLSLKVMAAGYAVAPVPGAYWVDHSVCDATFWGNHASCSKDTEYFYAKWKDKYGEVMGGWGLSLKNMSPLKVKVPSVPLR